MKKILYLIIGFICYTSTAVNAQFEETYCACQEGDTITQINYDIPFIYTANETQNGEVAGFHLSPLSKQNEYFIHHGPCVDGDETFCSPDAEVTCIFSNAILSVPVDITLDINLGQTSEAKPGLSSGLYSVPNEYLYLFDSPQYPLEIFSEGFCPCEIEEDFCAMSDLDFYLVYPTAQGESDESNVETSAALPPEFCMGDDITVALSTDCEGGLWINDGVEILNAEGEIANFEEHNHTFNWEIFGFGTITSPIDAYWVTVSGWISGDFLRATITDEGGCVSIVEYYLDFPFGRPYGELIVSDEDDCINQEFQLCYYDNSIIAAASEFPIPEGVWKTDGDATFSDPTTNMYGFPCITVTNLELGDRVVLELNELPIFDDANQAQAQPEECPQILIFYANLEDNNFCNLSATENGGILGSADGDLDDPCNCSDPLNIEVAGETTFFHDILTVNTGIPGIPVTVSNLTDWFDMNGMPVAGPIMAITDVNGQAFIDFWHEPDVGATADVNYSGITEMFVSSVCTACAPIPTVGQWGLMIIGLLAGIFGVVSIRQRVLVKNMG